jgi:hypothetical protein
VKPDTTVLSATTTFSMKFLSWLFPPVIVVASKGLATHPRPLDRGQELFMAGGAALMLLLYHRIKHVAVDDHALYVSNYLRRVRVPLSEVVDVSEWSLGAQSLIRLRFKHRTAFGKRVWFLADGVFRQLGMRRQPTPALVELRRRLSHAQDAGADTGDG